MAAETLKNPMDTGTPEPDVEERGPNSTFSLGATLFVRNNVSLSLSPKSLIIRGNITSFYLKNDQLLNQY